MQNSDERTCIEIVDIIDVDTGTHVEPNLEDDEKYKNDMMNFIDLIHEVGTLENDPTRGPNGFIARNKRVGLDFYLDIYYSAA